MQQSLFPQASQVHYGDNPRRQNLFLPKLLNKAAMDERLKGEAWDSAYDILKRWADLEQSGKLGTLKETTLRGEFLSEVFGEALGYTLFSANAPSWNLYPEFPVNSGSADAALGFFDADGRKDPAVFVELKGPNSNLDRDRSNGRTPVQQCWDYLNEAPDCPWGLVSNYVSFRLYHRNKTSRSFQLFLLQDLTNKDTFEKFYYLFQRGGLLSDQPARPSRALKLLNETGERQHEVGDELYNSYDHNRRKLILYLKGIEHKRSLEEALRITQKLIDRIVFVAFCEDRGLLPSKTINKAYTQLPPFSKVTNPRWRNFVNLFHSIDKGSPQEGISAYNGGLFRVDSEVDDLNLPDDWTHFFNSIGSYDFRDEVNVEVLGHLFERSVGDIGRIRVSGLFNGQLAQQQPSKMRKSAERKRQGIYYTPPDFTQFIVKNVVGKVIEDKFTGICTKLKLSKSDLLSDKPKPSLAKYYRDCLKGLRSTKIVDPACGSGAFLIAAYDLLEEEYNDCIDHLIFHGQNQENKLKDEIPEYVLGDNLYGVDLSSEAVEITQLALWIRSAREGHTLADLSKNVVCGNSLITDPKVHSRAMTWEEIFPEIFDRSESGFDCVIGNPPWERMKLQEREFFDSVGPDIASATSAAIRKKLIEKLKTSSPEIYERYTRAKQDAESALAHVRDSDSFPLTGRGDINTYALFAELAKKIVTQNGMAGLLVPSGIATDMTTRDFFSAISDTARISGLYDFENRKGIFPDIDGRMKFSILLFGGEARFFESTDFVFFAHSMDDLRDQKKHVYLSSDDIKLLNPNTRTSPIFRSQRDAELTKAIYRRVSILVDRSSKKHVNPWGIKFATMFHQTNDAELFHTAEDLKKKKYKRFGANWKKGNQVFLPLYEAKMVQMYDHRAASVEVDEANWMRQGQTVSTSPVQYQNPNHMATPRWWIEEKAVKDMSPGSSPPAFLTYKDVTSATNTRTMIASFIPFCGVLNSAPLVFADSRFSTSMAACLLGNLNSFVLDFVARQKVGGLHLNFFIVEQLPIVSPSSFDNKCPWSKRMSLEKWISERVLKLTCTSKDMKPLAKAASFEPPVHKWDVRERAELMAQLDAAFFILYEIERDDVEYILATFSGVKKEEDNLFAGEGTVNRILKHYDKFRAKMTG